jgi:hypothetical protein
MDKIKALHFSEVVIDMFGETSYELFTSQDSKQIVVRAEEIKNERPRKKRAGK